MFDQKKIEEDLKTHFKIMNEMCLQMRKISDQMERLSSEMHELSRNTGSIAQKITGFSRYPSGLPGVPG